MAETVTIDKDAAREMLGMANIGVSLCEGILRKEHPANAPYITEHEFIVCFRYMRRILCPAVYGTDWKGR